MIEKILKAKILKEYFEESVLKTFYDLDLDLEEGRHVLQFKFNDGDVSVIVFSVDSKVFIMKQDYEILEHFFKKYINTDIYKEKEQQKEIDLTIENLASAIFGTPKKKLH